MKDAVFPDTRRHYNTSHALLNVIAVPSAVASPGVVWRTAFIVETFAVVQCELRRNTDVPFLGVGLGVWFIVVAVSFKKWAISPGSGRVCVSMVPSFFKL